LERGMQHHWPVIARIITRFFGIFLKPRRPRYLTFVSLSGSLTQAGA
jgi:hypothetical protein